MRRLAEASREMDAVKLGISARGCLALIRVTKTWAGRPGESTSCPRTSRTLAQPVLSHRLILDGEAQFRGVEVHQVVEERSTSAGPCGARLSMPCVSPLC